MGIFAQWAHHLVAPQQFSTRIFLTNFFVAWRQSSNNECEFQAYYAYMTDRLIRQLTGTVDTKWEIIL